MKNKIKFINKANKKYLNKYNYSLVEYKNAHTKVKIVCPEHGIFEQIPYNHLRGIGCHMCELDKRKQKFLFKAKKTHNNLYDYSLVEYKNAHTKVKIVCPKHDIFKQTPANHILKKQGCPKCNYEKRRKKLIDFINKAKKIHNNFYNYKYVKFNNVNEKIKIICPEHGEFEQTVKSHLCGHGCRKCANKKIRLKTIERIKKNKLNNKQLYPNYNSKACEIFDEIMKENNIFIQHAENDGEFYIKELGYWLDGYDKENNVVYEYDEKYHKYQREKDKIREKEIKKLLKCKFIRINPIWE